MALDVTKDTVEFRIISLHFQREIFHECHSYMDPLIKWLYSMASTHKILIIRGDFNCVSDHNLKSKNQFDRDSGNATIRT